MDCSIWTVLTGMTRANPETTLSYASIMGLRTDTNLTGGQYSWLGSMFYFGTDLSSIFLTERLSRL
jgi:hypothetical protein